MNSIICIAIFSTLFLKVQSIDEVYYYAESECERHKNDSVEFSLASSGHSSSAFIKATHSFSYPYPFNCNITVSVRNSRDAHVLLKVRKISFPFKANCTSYIMIYQGNETGYRLCTTDDISTGKNEFTQSDSNQIKFLYHREQHNVLSFNLDDFLNSEFEILATAYTYAPCGKDLDFLCDNGRCISRKLVRDGYDNCGDKSDEHEYIIRNTPCGKDLDFLCDNGRCISKKLVRDGYDNCGDKSDEHEYIIRNRLSTIAITWIIIVALLFKAFITVIILVVRRKIATTLPPYSTFGTSKNSNV